MWKLVVALFLTGTLVRGFAEDQFQTDTISTSSGLLCMRFIGHGTLLFHYNGKVIHIDPYSKLADYEKLPDAHLILITHTHQDHLDQSALQKIRTPETVLIGTVLVAERVKGCLPMKNGEKRSFEDIDIEAVPAYNIVHKRDNGQPFHPRGEGNGYVLTFGNKRIYVAGDTENIPEMENLNHIGIAFLPMNLPYTMTPEMVADAALMIRPAILYPYHYGDTDPTRLTELLKNQKQIEVRIREMR